MKKEQSIKNIQLYYDNKLAIKKGFDLIDISTGIDWDYKHNHNSNTYQTYLHSLNIIVDFINVASGDEDKKLYKKGREIILNWYKADGENNAKWNEHAVSTRIQNIIRFQESNHNYKIRNSTYSKIIYEHCEFLNDESNYRKNNHGLMMDAALIFASSSITDERLKKTYLEKALYRIRYAFYRDFSRKGVYLENSPEYQQVVLALYRRIKTALKRHKLQPDKDLQMIIKNAMNYNKHIIKPDFTYPMIGDTAKIKTNSISKSYNNFIDYEAGIAILHYKNNDDENKSSYLTFKSGYQSKTHKHLDDLSITYFNLGHDILIDSGKYSYDKNDSIRKFLVSPAAHNTIVIKDKTYKLKNPLEEQEKLKISKVINTKDYKLVSGINTLYPGVTIFRCTILTADNILFVIDKVSSVKDETIIQNFIPNENTFIEKENELKYLLTIEEQEYTLETFKIRRNVINSKVEKSFISEKFAKYNESQRVSFESNSKQVTFVSAIYQKEKTSIDGVKFANNELHYICNNHKFTIRI